MTLISSRIPQLKAPLVYLVVVYPHILFEHSQKEMEVSYKHQICTVFLGSNREEWSHESAFDAVWASRSKICNT